MTPASQIRLPADRFYWAVLDTSGLGPRPSRESLGYLFESKLPMPVDHVHVVYSRLDGRSVLACGLSKNLLKADVDPGAVELSPDSIPEFIRAPGVDPASLNLLSGRFEPVRLRRARRRWALHMSTLLVACALLVAIGLERRTGAARAEALDLRAQTRIAYDRVLPEEGTQPPAIRLAAELRRLERTRVDPTMSSGRLEDVSPLLAEVLAIWPRDLHTTTRSIVATEEGITVTTAVPDMSAAEHLGESIDRLESWALQHPTVRQQRGDVAVTIRLERALEDPS